MQEDEQQDFVKQSLFQFVRKFVPSAKLSSIDEIVLSYVVSILEDLATASLPTDIDDTSTVEDVFDVEGFCEMLEAYFPQFSVIPQSDVCRWMFTLEETLRQSKTRQGDRDICDWFRKDLCLATPPARSNSESECSVVVDHSGSKRIHQLSETSDGSSDSSSGDYSAQEDSPYFTHQVSLLQEMFPSSCLSEIRHCLVIAEGDAGRAVQLVLHRQEAGQSLQSNAMIGQTTIHGHKAVANDLELKTRIINRYSYVDKDDDVREHRPVGPKVVPKKLVRYRDNKIVSLKGERFTDIKKDEEEDNVLGRRPNKQYH